jgi:hypothetical protein
LRQLPEHLDGKLFRAGWISDNARDQAGYPHIVASEHGLEIEWARRHLGICDCPLNGVHTSTTTVDEKM